MKLKINIFCKEPNDLKYLAFFRIGICLVLCEKLLSYIFHWRMLFSNDSFFMLNQDANWIHILFNNFIPLLKSKFIIILSLQLTLVLFYIFGIGRYFTAIAVFILQYLIQSFNPAILNGGDNLLIFVLFYLSFCNSFTYYTYGNYKIPSSNNYFMTNIGIFNIKFHLIIIYFIAAISKFNSEVWYNGIATYYTMNLTRFEGTSFNTTIGQNGYFVTLSTYGVMLFDMCFPFLIWQKSFRIPLIIIGTIMHIAFMVFMMIYDFELIFILIYGFFLKKDDWYIISNNRGIAAIKKMYFQLFNFLQPKTKYSNV